MSRAAGILLLCPTTQQVFLAKRSEHVGSPRTWAAPGGHIEPGESAMQAARREFREEVGTMPPVKLEDGWHVESPEGTYSLFVGIIGERHIPAFWRSIRLNWENEDAGWFDVADPPKPLHPGIRAVWPQLRVVAAQTLA